MTRDTQHPQDDSTSTPSARDGDSTYPQTDDTTQQSTEKPQNEPLHIAQPNSSDAELDDSGSLSSEPASSKSPASETTPDKTAEESALTDNAPLKSSMSESSSSGTSPAEDESSESESSEDKSSESESPENESSETAEEPKATEESKSDASSTVPTSSEESEESGTSESEMSSASSEEPETSPTSEEPTASETSETLATSETFAASETSTASMAVKASKKTAESQESPTLGESKTSDTARTSDTSETSADTPEASAPLSEKPQSSESQKTSEPQKTSESQETSESHKTPESPESSETPDSGEYTPSPPPARDDELIGLFGTRRVSFAERYHLTRTDKVKRLWQIARIVKQFDIVHGLTPVKMRLMLEALGPTFVKVGQNLSVRSEILPQSFCDELSKLRADADPMPYQTVIDTLNDEYGRPVDEIFEHIDPTPLGSASLAQVHRAKLVTGEDVAIKVQRPGVRETMAQDVSIMRSIAKAATKLFPSATQVVDLGGVVEELWDTFESETDFLIEARNLSEFKRFCNQYAYMDCPKPYMDLCTEHVVVMDYVDGISVSHPDQLVAAGYDLKEIGTKLVDNYATQVLDYGFFHADPHAGNIIIDGGKIVLIDLGMTGRLDAQTRSVLKEMIFAVAKQDSPSLADGLLRFSGTKSNPDDYSSLLADIDVIVKEYGTVDLKDLDIASFVTAITQLAQRHGIEVPSTVTTVARALVTLEGLLDEFIPDVNMIEIISDHIASSKSADRVIADEIKSLGLESVEAVHGLLNALSEAKVATRMLTRGQLRVNMEMTGAEEPMRRLSDMVNRLTMALIVVGLYVGSSIVYYAGVPPIVFGIPIVGLLGYIVAFILSVWIVFDIYFKGRRKSKKR